MIGIIDVTRNVTGIYGAGVLDYLLSENVQFEYAIGSSYGGANLVSYFARAEGSSYLFYQDYASRRDYMNFRNLLTDNNMIDVDLLYDRHFASFSKYPFNVEKAGSSGNRFYILASRVDNGSPHYFDMRNDVPDRFSVLKASCTIPLLNEPYPIGDSSYFDGYISDPLPFAKAFADGCEKVILILARPVSYRRDPHRDKILNQLLKGKFPHLAPHISQLSTLYNTSIEQALQLQKDGKMLLLSPNHFSPVQSLVKDRRELTRLYEKGRKDAQKIPAFLTR